MTSPQDPNQPPRPESPEPGQPAPQGWGQPPQGPPGWGAAPGPNQPGWGAPPPQGPPGWGAPPPSGPPGWGAPPPQGTPGWGAPQGSQGWGAAPGWAPQQSKSNKKGCLIVLVVFFVLIVALVSACAVTLGPVIGTEAKLLSDLGPRASSVNFNWNNGTTTFTIYLAPGQESQATYIACHIVKPDIQASSTPNAHFVIYGTSGAYGNMWLADENTPCS